MPPAANWFGMNGWTNFRISDFTYNRLSWEMETNKCHPIPSQTKSWGQWSHFFLWRSDKLLKTQAVTLRWESKPVFTDDPIMPQQGFYIACSAQSIAISRLIILSIRSFSANHLLLLYAKPRSKKAALASVWCNPKLANALSITSISCLSESH